jgi:hypothetical protein
MKIHLLFFITILSINTFAQEKEQEKKNLLSVSLGYTYIPKGSSLEAEEVTGVFVPSIGLDYFRRLHPRWEIGIMADVEMGEYVIFEKDLNREYAILLTAMVNFNLTKHINLLAGGGMEFENHKNLGIIRLGGEYVFKLPKNWVISPGFFFDFKEGTDTWSLSVAFGKEF